MNRKLLFVLVLSLIVVLSFGVAAKMIDGTYSLEGKVDSHGNYPTITIVVKDGKLASVDYKEIISSTNSPKTKDNYSWEPYFTAVETLEKKAVEENGDVSKLDAVASATSSSVKLKDMLLAVQLQAVSLKNAVYPSLEGTASHGYIPKLTITVAGGKISKVEYFDYNEKTGKPKHEDEYAWPKYFEAIEYFSDTTVKENGNIMAIDAVAGATGTSNTFFSLYRTLLNMILKAAKQ
ncbi:MAG: FMN-binding protein [Firmicutes bacterium]|nr:FMN-binding protein [Bacillota bacterium]